MKRPADTAEKRPDPRYWFKVRLPDTERGREVDQITRAKWEKVRPTRIMEAIELYDSLLEGDTTLLYEYFPFLRMVNSTMPSPPARLKKSPRIEYTQKSEAEDIDDLLDSLF